MNYSGSPTRFARAYMLQDAPSRPVPWRRAKTVQDLIEVHQYDLNGRCVMPRMFHILLCAANNPSLYKVRSRISRSASFSPLMVHSP